MEYLVQLKGGQRIRGEIIEVHLDIGVEKVKIKGEHINMMFRPDLGWCDLTCGFVLGIIAHAFVRYLCG